VVSAAACLFSSGHDIPVQALAGKLWPIVYRYFRAIVGVRGSDKNDRSNLDVLRKLTHDGAEQRFGIEPKGSRDGVELDQVHAPNAVLD
jgi:hypothetical protein